MAHFLALVSLTLANAVLCLAIPTLSTVAEQYPNNSPINTPINTPNNGPNNNPFNTPNNAQHCSVTHDHKPNRISKLCLQPQPLALKILPAAGLPRPSRTPAPFLQSSNSPKLVIRSNNVRTRVRTTSGLRRDRLLATFELPDRATLIAGKAWIQKEIEVAGIKFAAGLRPPAPHPCPLSLADATTKPPPNPRPNHHQTPGQTPGQTPYQTTTKLCLPTASQDSNSLRINILQNRTLRPSPLQASPRLFPAAKPFTPRPAADTLTPNHQMKNSQLRLAALAVAATGLVAVYHLKGQAEKKVSPAAIHKPSAIPDRIVLTWPGDPTSTAAVTWRTETAVKTPAAQIALAEDGPGFVRKARLVKAATETLQSDLSLAAYHSVSFTGLQPNTQYVYRVGDGANWSDWNQFATAIAGEAPVEFIYVGDSQNDLFSLWSRLIRQGYSDAPKSRFIIHAGDLVNSTRRDAEWGEWHMAAGWINRSVFSVPVPGNHEYPRADEKDEKSPRILSPHWRPTFTLPGNGVKGLEESNYYYDIQGVRVVALNSNVRQKEQAEWLDTLLANNPNRWTVLTFHHPIFSTAKGRDNKALREVWQPVFDKHKVDLVMTGHDHTYGRSNLESGLSKKDGGTVYVVSVSGPKMYDLEKQPWMVRAGEYTQLYQVIRIDKDMLRYEARTARGSLYDAFQLRKRKGKANLLTNLIPRTAEGAKPPEVKEEERKAREAKELKDKEEAEKKAKAATSGANN